MADITKANEQMAAWNKNLEKLQNGAFGDVDADNENISYHTMLRYWKAQASAGYPYANENVKYFEEAIKGRTNAKDREIERLAVDLNHIIEFNDNGFVARYATAEAFYNRGYRKVSEVVNEIVGLLEDLKRDYLLDEDIREACAVNYAKIKIEEKYSEANDEGI
jgi:hypothetical protein